MSVAVPNMTPAETSSGGQGNSPSDRAGHSGAPISGSPQGDVKLTEAELRALQLLALAPVAMCLVPAAAQVGRQALLEAIEKNSLVLRLMPVLMSGAPMVGSVARAGAQTVRVGQAGEFAVRAVVDIGPKLRIVVSGVSRIPDGLTSLVLSEVKNVAYQSFTQQIRDFLTYSVQNGLRFDLYVRSGAQLSQPLLDARAAGLINILEIP